MNDFLFFVFILIHFWNGYLGHLLSDRKPRPRCEVHLNRKISLDRSPIDCLLSRPMTHNTKGLSFQCFLSSIIALISILIFIMKLKLGSSMTLEILEICFHLLSHGLKLLDPVVSHLFDIKFNPLCLMSLDGFLRSGGFCNALCVRRRIVLVRANRLLRVGG